MLFKSIKAQMDIMFKSKTMWIAFYIVLGFVLWNYWEMFPKYEGFDVIYTPHPAKLSFLSFVNGAAPKSVLFFQIYPLLVILPAGFSLAKDYESKIGIFIYSKVGGMNYYMGKLIAAFLVSMFVFTVPFFIELAMNFVTYPIQARGENYFNAVYNKANIMETEAYLFGRWEHDYPYLAIFVGIMKIGIVSGVLNMFTVAVSTINVPFKVWLFFPVYILLYGLVSIGFHGFSTNYMMYLYTFCGVQNLNLTAFLVTIVILLVLSIGIMYRKGKQELLI